MDNRVKRISKNCLTLTYNLEFFPAGNLISSYIQAFLFSLTKIRQLKNNLWSQTDYKKVCNKLYIVLIQSDFTPLTKKLCFGKELAKYGWMESIYIYS